MHGIEAEVRAFVVDNFLFGDDTDLTSTDSFLERAVIDSTGVLELVGFLEQRYRITVEDHELIPANLDSIERVARFVRGKLPLPENTIAG
jgi:acyl carrier protein